MNTHILIPIKDIKLKIAEWNLSFMRKTEIDFLKSLLKGKQISLDEKDIEEAADKYANNQEDADVKNLDRFHQAKETYSQALKNLL